MERKIHAQLDRWGREVKRRLEKKSEKEWGGITILATGDLASMERETGTERGTMYSEQR